MKALHALDVIFGWDLLGGLGCLLVALVKHFEIVLFVVFCFLDRLELILAHFLNDFETVAAGELVNELLFHAVGKVALELVHVVAG